MKADRWATDPRTETATVAPLAQEVAAPIAVPLEMNDEQVEAKAQELGDGLRAARRERDEAAVEVATAEGGRIEAAGRGFEAAKEAQRAIVEAKERLTMAQLVVEAVESAYAPVAQEQDRRTKIRSAERFGAAMAEKGRERDALEVDVIKILDELGAATAARDRLTGELLEIKRSADAAGHRQLPAVEVGYSADTVTRTLRALGIPLARAVAS